MQIFISTVIFEYILWFTDNKPLQIEYMNMKYTEYQKKTFQFTSCSYNTNYHSSICILYEGFHVLPQIWSFERIKLIILKGRFRKNAIIGLKLSSLDLNLHSLCINLSIHFKNEKWVRNWNHRRRKFNPFALFLSRIIRRCRHLSSSWFFYQTIRHHAFIHKVYWKFELYFVAHINSNLFQVLIRNYI